jgi:hypothetical protein
VRGEATYLIVKVVAMLDFVVFRRTCRNHKQFLKDSMGFVQIRRSGFKIMSVLGEKSTFCAKNVFKMLIVIHIA